MNVYDFDGTIYDGDSTFDFYKYCMKKHPAYTDHPPCLAWSTASILKAFHLQVKKGRAEALPNSISLPHQTQTITWCRIRHRKITLRQQLHPE